jgi:hypothetical protein
MSLQHRFLAVVLMSMPIIGCDADEDDKRPAAPAPAEPTRPVPQPQVGPAGRADRAYAVTRTTGPAFALSVG